jgi:hypothetical protein
LKTVRGTTKEGVPEFGRDICNVPLQRQVRAIGHLNGQGTLRKCVNKPIMGARTRATYSHMLACISVYGQEPGPRREVPVELIDHGGQPEHARGRVESIAVDGDGAALAHEAADVAPTGEQMSNHSMGKCGTVV